LTRALCRLWIWLTYWKVACEGCDGTGVCAGKAITAVHSCCGDCRRVKVPLVKAPPGWEIDNVAREYGHIILGDGVMYRRPWSKRQVELPRGYA